MRLLFIRPPKYLWPYMNEQDNYLLPQAVVWLAASARAQGHEVHVLDCMAEQAGWATVARRIEALRPDVVLAGDSETLYAHETGRLFQLVKQVAPHARTVAGGVHFSHAGKDALGRYPIDAIVRGEGEITMGRLLAAWQDGGDVTQIPGLALPDGAGGVVYTGHAPLVENLDDLPFPAYDLLPMHKYGTARYLFSPGGVTIHHSRGCVDNCAYCACWLQMARREGEPPDETLRPRYRTRSVGPVVDEMELLARRYDKRCLVFVDDTWNVDAAWADDFATELLRRRLDLTWFAFMRADYLARDEASGLFGKLIASGLTHICVGLERDEDEELAALEKHRMNAARNAEVIRALRRKYPALFLQTTFIVGLRQDSPARLDRLLNYVEQINPDYPAFHPLTPVPGTALWREAREKGWLQVTDFARYDWMTPVMDTEHMTRDDLERKIWEMNRRYLRLRRILRGVLSRHRYRRRMYVWWLQVSLRVLWDFVLDRVVPSRSVRRRAELSDYVGMIKPEWYDR
jgi:anaerobic magnesium-protoporphyrin IX monomethyl ester cyclase